MKAGDDRNEQLRLALIASGDYDPTKLLPGRVNVIAAQDERRGSSAGSSGAVDEVEDYSEVQWESPSTMGAEEVMNDLEKFNAAMAANESITINGEDDGGEWL